MTDQTTQKIRNIYTLVVAIAVVSIFIYVWFASLQAVTTNQQDIIERNTRITQQINAMSCNELAHYIGDHGYLYSYASEKWHSRCE